MQHKQFLVEAFSWKEIAVMVKIKIQPLYSNEEKRERSQNTYTHTINVCATHRAKRKDSYGIVWEQ